MSFESLATLFREALMLLAVVGGPMMGVLFGVGLIVGILQSATQIQEPAVGALPRLATVVALTVFLGPWMAERLARFLAVAIERLSARPF
jgi:flagellar biosynthetic protein FliQ